MRDDAAGQDGDAFGGARRIAMLALEAAGEQQEADQEQHHGEQEEVEQEPHAGDEEPEPVGRPSAHYPPPCSPTVPWGRNNRLN